MKFLYEAEKFEPTLLKALVQELWQEIGLNRFGGVSDTTPIDHIQQLAHVIIVQNGTWYARASSSFEGNNSYWETDESLQRLNIFAPMIIHIPTNTPVWFDLEQGLYYSPMPAKELFKKIGIDLDNMIPLELVDTETGEVKKYFANVSTSKDKITFSIDMKELQISFDKNTLKELTKEEK